MKNCRRFSANDEKNFHLLVIGGILHYNLYNLMELLLKMNTIHMM